MSQFTENQNEIVGSPSESRASQSEVIAHLRESTQKIDALERQIAQLYTLLNEKYATNTTNNNNDKPVNYGIPAVLTPGTQPPTPTLEDALPNAANFLHMRRRKKKRHRKQLLDLRGRVSLTPSLRSPALSAAPTNAPSSPSTRLSQSLTPSVPNNTTTTDSVNIYPSLLRSNLNMRVINTSTTPTQNSSHTSNPQLYESDSRIYGSISENPVEPSSPVFVRRSMSSSSDSAVQGEDSDAYQEPPQRSIRVSVKPPISTEQDNNNSNNNTTTNFDITNQPISYEPGTESPELRETIVDNSNNQPPNEEPRPSRELLRKTSTGIPFVADALKTDDNDVERESYSASLSQGGPVSPGPVEEPRDNNNNAQTQEAPSPQQPEQANTVQSPPPVERKGTLKSSKIRDVFNQGIQRAKSFVKPQKPEAPPISPLEHIQTEQDLESELESLLFSSTEGLWDHSKDDGAPKLFNISIILENYDDIFSDFDPRPYSVRTVSDDFLDECRRRIARVPNKGLKELGQLALLVPGKRRDLTAEQIIIRRLQQHFNRGYQIQKSNNRALWRRGFIWIIMGMIVIAITLVLIAFQQQQDDGTVVYWVLNILGTWLNPAGSFFFWEGLEHLFFYVRENSSELEFYRDMSKISFQFHTIDSSLQSKLRLAYANYRGKQ